MRSNINFFRPFCLLILGMSVAIAGCNNSPATARVSGTVTLDGKPLAGADVTFTPTNGERSSSGHTNAQGKYSLRFSASSEGAVPGEHSVDIRTGALEPDKENPVKETVPEKYNKATELKSTLKGGTQTVNFDLKS